MSTFAAKLGRAGTASMFFLLLLASIYVIHARFLRVDVVFYAALFDVAIASSLAGAWLWRARCFYSLQPFEKLQLLLIWLLLGYALAISLPTVIDRSLSFYLLEKLDQRGGAIRQDAFARIFVEEYLPEHRLVDVRLTEQLKSGTIELDGGCVRITAKGRYLAAFSRAFRRWLLPRRRLLMGNYSGQLTDPLRRGVAAPAGCELPPQRDPKVGVTQGVTP